MKKLNLRHVRISSLVFASLILASAYAPAADDASSSLPAPPVAKKAPKTTEINGRTMVDNYYWLRDKKNPEVKAYLEAENAYTDAVMKPTEGLQKKLYDEMLSRIKETDIEVPYKEGDYFYYSRTEAGKQYQIHCRKKGGMDAPEEVVLDVNEMAKGQKFMSLGAYNVSDDGNLLAYTTDNTGFRQYSLAVKDLRTGKLLPDHAERVGSVVWANDNKTIFYTVEDDTTKRQYQVYRHTAGASGSDKLAYEEKDEKFDVYAAKTRSKAYIVLFSASHTTSEARYLPAGEPAAEWKVMQPRKQGVEYYSDHNGMRPSSCQATGRRNPGPEPTGAGKFAHQISPCEITTHFAPRRDGQRTKRTGLLVRRSRRRPCSSTRLLLPGCGVPNTPSVRR